MHENRETGARTHVSMGSYGYGQFSRNLYAKNAVCSVLSQIYSIITLTLIKKKNTDRSTYFAGWCHIAGNTDWKGHIRINLLTINSP